MLAVPRYSISDRPNMVFDHESLTRTFFIRIGNPLFQEFIDSWKTAQPSVDIDLGVKITGAKPADLVEGWSDWVERNRPAAGLPEQDFLCINDLGRRKGKYILVDAANRCGLPDGLIPQKMAMLLYLHHPRHFWGAYNSLMARKVGAHRHFRGREAKPLSKADVAAKLGELKVAMAPLVAESRYGVPTDFDLLEVGTNTILLMSYPYLREGIRHLDDVSKKTVYSERQLIKDGMFLFDNQHGSMKMKYGRSPKLMDGLCQVLGKVFFNDPEWYTDELSCDLDRLADRDLTDSIPPNSPFKAVTTTKLVFRSRRSGTWITLDSKKGVWTEYWRLCKVQPGDMVVRSGKLSLDWHQGGRAKTVEVNFPNRTSLNETENDRLAEQLLRDLGIVRSGPWGVEGENE